MSGKDLPLTASSKCFRVASYTFAGWCRLREVCCALKEMQGKVTSQRQEIDYILKSEEDCRQAASLVQTETIELHLFQERIERSKCRLMTIQLKLIRLYGDMETKDKETVQRRNEILEMDSLFQERISAILLARDKLSVASSRLILRRRKMLKELMVIFKIDLEGLPSTRVVPSVCSCVSVATIAGLHLPDPRFLAGHSEIEVATAAGNVVQLLILISQVLNVSLRFPVSFVTSKSSIMNPVSTEIFPLYSLAKNREKFENALDHLNANVAQLRSDCGLATPNKNSTLANLHNLFLHLTVEDVEPNFPRPFHNIQSPSSMLRTTISDSALVDRLKKVSEIRKSLNLSNVQSGRKMSRCFNVDLRNTSLLFDSSAVAALNLTSHPVKGESPKVTHSETLDGELIYS